MAFLHGKENIPNIGDVVEKVIVNLFFDKQSFDYDFCVTYKSGKSCMLHGWYGNDTDKNGAYEKYATFFKNIDLNKYKDDKFDNFFKIPIDVFEQAVETF